MIVKIIVGISIILTIILILSLCKAASNADDKGYESIDKYFED